ncbi:MAG: 1-acyl-sn-glycerol-3-phosphate acyltransferase [Clostridia bacterium]|nr:1-acyl-sn-glycerol-3-phosphate acyltransferase [Clostridia bacterium]
MIFVLAFIVFKIYLIFYPTKVIHKERYDRKKKYIITSNHFSNLDSILYDATFWKKFRFLGKKELFKSKFSSWIMRQVGVIPVDREKVAPSTFKEILSVLNKNGQIFIYPEGTRNKQEAEGMQDAKDGVIVFASKGETEILPMLLYRKPKAFRKNYIIIGEPIQIQGENPKRLTKEEVEQNLENYTKKMEELRAELNAYVEGKKRRKKKEKIEK